MTSVDWCDFSEFQRVIDNTYPHPVAAFRSNDGTYRDRHFAANHAWAKSAVDSGKLAFFIVYAVYEPDGGNWVSTLMSMVGTPHPRMVVMMDIESWGGRINSDHSADINAGRARLAQWLGSSRRVIGYGNVGDLNRLWPNKGDAQLVVAAYGSNPSYPNKIAHQYTSSGSCPPFGSPVDMNSADGLDVPTLMTKLGLTATPAGGGAQPFNPPIQEDDMPIHIQRQSSGDTWTVAPGQYIKHHPDAHNGDLAGYLTTGTGGRTDFRPLSDGDLSIAMWDLGFPELGGDLGKLPVKGATYMRPTGTVGADVAAAIATAVAAALPTPDVAPIAQAAHDGAQEAIAALTLKATP